MDSLQWVDKTYIQKHKSEDPNTLRAMYYPNLRMYTTHGDTSKHREPMDATLAFLIRYSRRAGLSLAIYMLSYLPVVGRLVLPAASFYTFNNAVGPIPATVIFGSGIFLPRRYLIVFLQSYFSSRSLMRELVSCFPSISNTLALDKFECGNLMDTRLAELGKTLIPKPHSCANHHRQCKVDLIKNHLIPTLTFVQGE